MKKLQVDLEPQSPTHSNCYVIKVKVRLMEQAQEVIETLRQLRLANVDVKYYDREGKEYNVNVTD